MLSALLISTLILAGTTDAVSTATSSDCNIVFWGVEPVAQVFPQVRPDDAGYLGVSLIDLDPEHARALRLSDDRGVEIRMVMEGGPADKAGIQPGDVILSYNSESIMGAQHLSRLVRETPPGRHVKVQYWRDGKTLFTVVTIGAASSNPNRIQSPGVPDWPVPPIDFPSPLLVWHNPIAGIDFEHVDSQLAAYFGVKSGVLVRAVQPGSPAERAGMRAGDVIFSVGQQTLVTEHEVTSLLRQHSSVQVSVMRDHKRVDLMLHMP